MVEWKKFSSGINNHYIIKNTLLFYYQSENWPLRSSVKITCHHRVLSRHRINSKKKHTVKKKLITSLFLRSLHHLQTSSFSKNRHKTRKDTSETQSSNISIIFVLRCTKKKESKLDWEKNGLVIENEDAHRSNRLNTHYTLIPIHKKLDL